MVRQAELWNNIGTGATCFSERFRSFAFAGIMCCVAGLGCKSRSFSRAFEKRGSLELHVMAMQILDYKSESVKSLDGPLVFTLE